MENKEKLHLSAIVNNWVQVLGIFLAGGWALYTFAYLQIYVPATKVSYFKIDLTLEKVGENKNISSGTNTVAVLAKLTGSNTSQKNLSIASGYLELWGDKIVDFQNDKEKFKSEIPGAIDDYNSMAARYFAKREGELIFVGSIFKNWSFEPGETATIYRMIYLPENIFDHVEANAWVLSGPNARDIKVNYVVKDNSQIEYTAIEREKEKETPYSQDSQNFKELMIKNKIGKSSSNCYLSLWDNYKNNK